MRNAIIQDCTFVKLSGALVTCLDYYVFCKDNFIPCDLVLIGPPETKKYVKDMLWDRYNYKAKDLILLPDATWLLMYVFDVVMLHFDTYKDTHRFIRADRIECLGSYGSRNATLYKLDMKGINYSTEYPEFSDLVYTKKIYFERLAMTEPPKERVYLNVGPKYILKGNDEMSLEYLLDKLSEIKKELIIYVDRWDRETTKVLSKYYEVFSQHRDNFLTEFDTLLYIHLNCFDYSPRLILESSYLGKEILYINDYDVKDGCAERIEAHRNRDYSKFNLTTDDYIIRLFNGNG